MANNQVSGRWREGAKPSFEQMKQNCLQNGKLFEDPNFEMDISSLQPYITGPVEWKRPFEIIKDPHMFVDGASRFDVRQGQIGDCWMLSAISSLTMNKELLKQVIPEDQGFTEKYAGIFHFRFWQYGRWKEVIIDDRLPTKNGVIQSMKSSQPNEFWSSLLEKAYAKCIGGAYAALKGGNCSEAMEDFSGGVCEVYHLNNASPKLYTVLLKAYERSSLMGCTTPPSPDNITKKSPEGLVYGHVYSITGIKHLRTGPSDNVPLLRLRNPWGCQEWKGAWSDSSAEWTHMPQKEKDAFGWEDKDDGEFWISYQDFLKHFKSVEICHLRLENTEDPFQKKWALEFREGSWVKGSTAGGSIIHAHTFKHNPRFLLTIKEVEQDNDGKCCAIIALMQKRSRHYKPGGLSIGYYVYKLDKPESVPDPLDFDYVQMNDLLFKSGFSNYREVSGRYDLLPGSYCLIAATEKPNQEGKFIFRICTEKVADLTQNLENIAIDIMISEPSSEELEDEVHIQNVFLKTAGPHREIDWEDLLHILNYAADNMLHIGFSHVPILTSSAVLGGILLLLPLSFPHTYGGFLPEFPFGGFDKNSCRSMITMLDVDMSGKLGLQEFMELCVNLRMWTKVFKYYDRGCVGRINPYDLRDALKSSGFYVSNDVLSTLMMRYGDKEGRVAYDDFIMCCIKLKTIKEMLGSEDNKRNAQPIALQEWMKKTLYM